MKKRMSKKQLTRKPSKTERIKYWSRAYRNLSFQYSDLEEKYNYLMGNAIKLAINEKHLQEDRDALIIRVRVLEGQLETVEDKLKRIDLHNVALKQELEESRNKRHWGGKRHL